MLWSRSLTIRTTPGIARPGEKLAELLAVLEATGEMEYGAAALPNCIIAKTDGVSDLLELALLLKEAGLLRPGPTPQLEAVEAPMTRFSWSTMP